MTATRRQTLRLLAASALAGALPMGHKPAVLAAETAGVDVLDNAEVEAEQAIISREKWSIFTFPEEPGHMRCAQLFVERLRDGSARLVFELPKTDLTKVEQETEVGRFVANPRRQLLELRLDAATLAELDRGIDLEYAALSARTA